ncbi:hypothetical protein CPC08DRAFT_336070 [Agrocybe pediades]|nr:hypothetical protein CPC08DRAFT_336070 [Agrocybe pediades]
MDPTIPPNIAAIAGPLILAYLLHWGLFGALCVQIYIYYLAFPRDVPGTKILVYGVYLAELAQTFMFTYQAFESFAAGFGEFSAVTKTRIIWFSVPILSSTVSFVVQLFYAYRIKILSRSNFVAGIILMLAIVQWAGGIATGVLGQEQVDLSNFLSKKTYITLGLWNGGAAVCDVLIAAFMTYFLSRRKSEWKPTQRIVHRLIRLIVETGTITAAIAIANLALSLLPSKPTYYQTTSGVLGKMYSNTMMAVFNSRISFRRHESSTRDESYNYFERSGNNAVSGQRPVISEGTITITRDVMNDGGIPLKPWDSSAVSLRSWVSPFQAFVELIFLGRNWRNLMLFQPECEQNKLNIILCPLGGAICS